VEKRSYAWKPIQLWEGPWVSDGLDGVFRKFREHAGEIVYEEFLRQVITEWSITTGEIEDAYHIGPGMTKTMIASGITPDLIPRQRNGLSSEDVYDILKDHEDTIDGLFEYVRDNRRLEISDIKQMHQQLLRSVDTYTVFFVDPVTKTEQRTQKALDKGKFKSVRNSPSRDDGTVHEYCPVFEVDSQMELLVKLFEEFRSKCQDGVVVAAWLHHAFTQIHPFQDGNGRVARLLASLVLIRSGLPSLVVTLEMKIRYREALEAADHGNPRLLLEFFESCMYRQAVRLWHELKMHQVDAVNPGASLKEILAGATARLAAKHDLLPIEWAVANATLELHRKRSAEILMEYGNAVHTAVREIKSEFHAQPGHTSFPVGSLSVAWNEEWGEGFSLGEVRAEVLGIQTGTLDQVVVGFDSFSPGRKGICGVFVALRRGDLSERVGKSYFIHFDSGVYQERFERWLKPLLEEALRMWQEKLG
jgi:fido (protein-threonine AMPylation protein)